MTSAGAALPWFPAYRPEGGVLPVTRPDAIVLFCLPHAGAGASAYWEWVPLLAPEFDVVPVQLPGRESRYKEPLRRSVFDLAAELIDPLTQAVASRGKAPNFAIFGHSMGALLGYELTRVLVARGMPPRHLYVSGHRAPNLPQRRPIVHLMPDPEMLAVIEELEGTASEVLSYPELVEMLLPVMRADFEVCEAYSHRHDGPLPVPITALGGLSDPSVSAEEVRAWRDLTSASFEARVYPGGHFYLQDLRDEVIAVLRRSASPQRAV